jgi:hypothetical protein
VTVYTNSRYAFGTVHVHGAIYQERGFITAEGKELCNLLEIQRLRIVVQKPQAVAVYTFLVTSLPRLRKLWGTGVWTKRPEMLLWPPRP